MACWMLNTRRTPLDDGQSDVELGPTARHCDVDQEPRPDRVYRHRWIKGDVVMWDNRCTMHYAVHDYGEQPRGLHRISLTGDTPR